MRIKHVPITTLALTILSLASTAQANGSLHSNTEIIRSIKANQNLVSNIQVKEQYQLDSRPMVKSEVDQNAEHNALYLADGDVNNSGTSQDALLGASGNIGLNVVAGENNLQQNSIVLAMAEKPAETADNFSDSSYAMTTIADATLVFGAAANAETLTIQSSSYNRSSSSYGITNKASLSGNAGMEVDGNIGVNLAVGNGNVQANQIVVANAEGVSATATISTRQSVYGNVTDVVLRQISPNSTKSHTQNTRQFATANTALVDGNAFARASGNIGINVAAGGNNLQSNSIAIADVSLPVPTH